MVKIHVKMLPSLKAIRPSGYVEALESAGTVNGDYLEVAETDWERLQKQFPPGPDRKTPGLGDRVELMAKPIARALRMDCLDAQGELKPDSGCAKRRAWLNEQGRKLGIG